MSALGFSIKEFFLNVAANIAAGTVGLDDTIGYAIGLAFVLACIVSWHRKRIAGGKRGVDSWYSIALALVVASIAIASAGYGIGLRAARPAGADTGANVPAPKQPQYVTGQDIGAGYNRNPGTETVIRYGGIFSVVGNRLRVFVDLAQPTPSHIYARRIQIRDEFKDFVPGQALQASLLIRTEDAQTKRWAFNWNTSENDAQRFDIGTYFARVALIGDSGEEQRLYFMIVPNVINNEPFIQVLSHELQFLKRWEAQDTQN